MWGEDPATRSLGMVLEHVAPGEARISMEVRPEMANGHGMCHGGFIYTLADSTFAFACNTYNERVVAQQCAITYIRPGQVGTRLVAEARERSRWGRSGIYDVTVRDGAGELIAEFRGHSRSLGQKMFQDLTT